MEAPQRLPKAKMFQAPGAAHILRGTLIPARGSSRPLDDGYEASGLTALGFPGISLGSPRLQFQPASPDSVPNYKSSKPASLILFSILPRP